MEPHQVKVLIEEYLKENLRIDVLAEHYPGYLGHSPSIEVTISVYVNGEKIDTSICEVGIPE